MACSAAPGWGFDVDDRLLKERGTLVHWRT
jgi:hypothetical protein